MSARASAPAPSAWFRCAAGCDFRAELVDVVYECPRCSGLLEVEHDRAALAARSGDDWKALFDSRFKLGAWPYGSGVWGKKEWVYPQLATENVVSMFEGGSPLLRVDRYARELGLDDVWVKECGVTHTGSFKDLGMTVLVSAVNEMRARGQAVRAVACASTGDTSAALSAYCAAAGIPSVVLLPRGKISTAQLVQPISNGALVLELDTDFDGCMRVVRELAHTKDIYLANSMNSLRIEGQKTASIEIAQQLGWSSPDWIVIPGGNLGNASAVGKGFLLMKELGLVDRLPRLVVAQAAQANPLWRATSGAGVRPTAAVVVPPVAAQRTLASAIQIGAPVSAKRALRALEALDGVVEQATEQELADAAARADRAGLFTCPHTGVALAALEKLAARGAIRRGERVVVISTAHGLKFSDFKVGYHDGTLPGIASPLRNPGVKLAATLGAVQDAIAARFGQR
ncbi:MULTISPECIES: threonine synthase [unclassified Anaeromyxobacter]|uniref:threonine synthase n=1 Tax=unclassified Anaeromyxobacter TaxID=2620896 RepID=UPI001F58D4FE|nr:MULTISPECIES: threonine synthase [unclassified Anaeromyxobacter]